MVVINTESPNQTGETLELEKPAIIEDNQAYKLRLRETPEVKTLTNEIQPTGDKAVIQTFMFTVFIYSIIFNSLNTRSEGFDLFNHIKSNTMFIWVMTSIAIFQSLIIQFGGKVFGTVPMDLEHFGLALLIAILIIPIDFIRKAIISNK